MGTPKRNDTYLEVDILFEPDLQIGQIVQIVSQTNPAFDGQYKIFGIKHSGTISGVVGGDCRTSLQLFVGTRLFKIVDKLVQNYSN